MGAREQIIKAADKLFGEVGFDAATTREIAELSGVNKALIHYHFKSKEALLENVLDRYYEQLNVTFRKALGKKGSMRDRFANLVDTYVDFLASNLNFSRIVQRESSGGKHMDRVSENLLPIFKMGMQMIQEAYPSTRSGDLAAHQMLVSFYGMIISYFTYSGVIEKLLDNNPLSKKEIELRKRHLMRMLDIVVEAMNKDEAAAKSKKKTGRENNPRP